MATRNIVPRANNEGKLGTPSKAWSEANIGSINASSINVPKAIIASGAMYSTGTIYIAGGSNVTIGTSAGQQIIINAAAGGGGGVLIAAGSQTGNTSGTVLFQNSNGLSFGMSNNSVITASIPSIPSTFDDLGEGTTNKAFTATEQRLLRNLLSSGLLKGGILSINADPTKFNMTAAVGVIVDNSDPEIPVVTSVSIGAQTGITDDYAGTDAITYVTVNSAGNIILTPIYPDEETRRDIILIGWLDHPEMTGIIIDCWTEPYYNTDIQSQINDFFEARGPFNIWGNDFFAATGLQIQREEGASFDSNSNYAINPKNPHVLYTGVENPVTFVYYYRDVTPGDWVDDGTPTTTVDPNYYDDGSGTLAAVSSGYWTIQVISWYPLTLANDIQYGQNEYASLNAAKAAIRDAIEVNPYNAYDIMRGWLIVKQGTTDLTDTDEAVFIEADVAFTMEDLENGGGGVLHITDHNDLDNIQGGQVGERYHLNSENYINVTQYASQLSNYLTSQSIQTQNIINAVSLSGNNTAGVMANISSGTIYMAGGNNITISQNANSITISGPIVGGAQTGISGQAVSDTTYSSGSVYFSGQNNITLGSSVNGASQYIRLSVGNYITTGMLSNANTSFVGLNSAVTNMTMTVNSSGISISNPGWLTTAANSTHTHGNPTLNLTNISGTTASASNGLTISLSAGNYLTTAMASNQNTSFVNASAAFQGYNATGTIASNGISISVAAPGAAAEANQMNLSGNVAGNTTASGSTINWVGGNNITLSGLNNSQIRIDAAAGGGGFTKSIKLLNEDFIGFNTGTVYSSHGTQYFFSPLHMDSPLSISNVWMAKSMIVASGTSSNSSGRQSHSYVHSLYFFKRDNYGTGSTNLSYYTSASYGFSVSRSHTSNNNSITCNWVTNSTGGTSSWSTASAGINYTSYFSGLRFHAIPIVTSLSQGEWFIAHRHSSTTATSGSNVTLMSFNNLNLSLLSGVGYAVPLFGTNSTLSNPFHGIGFGSATAITTNATMPATVISAGGSLQMQHGMIVNMGVS